MHTALLPWLHRDEPLQGTALVDDQGPSEDPILTDDQTSLGREAFLDRVEAFAEQLADLGVRRGDTVAVMLPPRVEALITVYAAWRLGAVVNPVNPALRPDEVAEQLADTDARVVVNLDALAPDGGRTTVHLSQMRRVPEGTLPPAEVDPDGLALVLHTIGRPGRPRGACFSHRSLQVVSEAATEALDLTADDHLLLTLPLHLPGTLVTGVLAPLLAGARVSLNGAGRSGAVPVDVHPTHLCTVPAALDRLAGLPEEHAPSRDRLRVVTCPGPVPDEVVSRVEGRYDARVVAVHGQTETTGWTACTGRSGLVGLVPAVPGQEIQIADRFGRSVPPGTVGEVLVRGPQVMRGYVDDFTGLDTPLVDGWLRTGEHGRLDRSGALTLVDRAPSQIGPDGASDSLEEIETRLQQVEGVYEAVAVDQTDQGSDRALVFVEPCPGLGVAPDVLRNRCRAQLARTRLAVDIQVLG